jgi:hypothetical protein
MLSHRAFLRNGAAALAFLHLALLLLTAGSHLSLTRIDDFKIVVR